MKIKLATSEARTRNLERHGLTPLPTEPSVTGTCINVVKQYLFLSSTERTLLILFDHIKLRLRAYSVGIRSSFFRLREL